MRGIIGQNNGRNITLCSILCHSGSEESISNQVCCQGGFLIVFLQSSRKEMCFRGIQGEEERLEDAPMPCFCAENYLFKCISHPVVTKRVCWMNFKEPSVSFKTHIQMAFIVTRDRKMPISIFHQIVVCSPTQTTYFMLNSAYRPLIWSKPTVNQAKTCPQQSFCFDNIDWDMCREPTSLKAMPPKPRPHDPTTNNWC